MESRSWNQICQWNLLLEFMRDGARVSASLSASGECEHDHIVVIHSLLDLHEHGGDTDGPMLVSNTTSLELCVDIRQ
jgi:hypothetical protein